jgi:hypothetical protein
MAGPRLGFAISSSWSTSSPPNSWNTTAFTLGPPFEKRLAFMSDFREAVKHGP